MVLATAASVVPAPVVPTTATDASAIEPDPEVADATERYGPRRVGLDRDRFATLVDIAGESLAGLAPVVVVNRRVDSAMHTLRQPDGRFGTIHTSPVRDTMGMLRRMGRELTETGHDTFGTGANEGRTVFGSTRFVSVDDAQRGAQALLAALTRDGMPAGVHAYGPVSIVVPEAAVRGRVTFAARDTAISNNRVTDASNLAQVVAERVAHGVHGLPDAATLASQPRAAAVDALRGWLLGGSLGRRDSYIEAQVRGMVVGDVAAIDVSRRRDPEQAFRQIDPGPLPDRALVRDLARAAREHGIRVQGSR